jgi:peptide deformylase
MALLPLRYHPDPILRVKCKRISLFDESLRKLIDDMAETMKAHSGVGLAAPQVGVPLRLFVAGLPDDADDPLAGKVFAFANPEIIRTADEYETEEGCLSIPGWVGDVVRFERVTIKGRDRHGREIRVRGEGLLAQAFQHETEHLDGKLFIDAVVPGTLHKLEPAEPREVADAIGKPARAEALR